MITSHPRCTADRGRSALPKTVTQRETGNRRIGWGHFFRVSGLGRQVPGSGVQVRVQVQKTCHPSSVICHRCSHLPVSGGRWRPRVAGGRPDPFSPPFRPQRSPPWSTEAARSARSADPTSRQCPEITKNDAPRTKNSIPTPTLSDSAVGTPFSTHPQFCLELPCRPAI